MYHVLNRSVANLPLFRQRADYEALERILIEEVERIRKCIARCRPYGSEDWQNRQAEDLGLWRPLRREGLPSKQTNRKPRPSWRRFAVAWPAASPAEASRGSAERRNNLDRNQRCEHHTSRERGSRTNDFPDNRVCPPFFSLPPLNHNFLLVQRTPCLRTENSSKTEFLS